MPPSVLAGLTYRKSKNRRFDESFDPYKELDFIDETVHELWSHEVVVQCQWKVLSVKCEPATETRVDGEIVSSLNLEAQHTGK